MAGGVNVQARELLPANVIPRHYHVTLEPDLKAFTFDGTVVIDLDVAEDSKSISLHTLELDIHSAKITSGGQTVRLVSCHLSPCPLLQSGLPCMQLVPDCVVQ
jgi:aminopeptidase 2